MSRDTVLYEILHFKGPQPTTEAISMLMASLNSGSTKESEKEKGREEVCLIDTARKRRNQLHLRGKFKVWFCLVVGRAGPFNGFRFRR